MLSSIVSFSTMPTPAGIQVRHRIAALGALLVLTFAATTLRAQNVSAPLAVTTLAGTAGERQVTNGTGSAARFYAPAGLILNAQGDLIVADTCNNLFRKVTAAGVVSIFSGAPIDAETRPINIGSADGSASQASFHIGDYLSSGGTYGTPIYTIVGSNTLGIDSSGNIYFADTMNNTVRKIASDGSVTTIAGTPGSQGNEDGPGTSARFLAPGGVAVDSAGNVYVADSGNNTVRKITPARVVSTLAGTARTFGSTDGTGTAARFLNPSGVAVDTSGNVYVTDSGNHIIRKISASGVVTTLAGSAGNRGTADGGGTQARFNNPTGVTVDSTGFLYVADTSNHAIRKISPTGTVSTIAGSVGISGTANGTGTAAQFNEPYGVTVSSSGTLYISDSSNNTIRQAIPASTTDSLQVTAVPPPLIQTTVNSNVTLKIVASGSPSPSYQWYKGGVAISGATNATLAMTSVTGTNAGNYSVIVTSGSLTYSSALTQVQVFTVGTPVPSVTIVTQPTDRTVAAGQSASFTVEATSSGTLTYQWSKGGTAIVGATNATYTVGSAQSADAGVYAVTVTDGSSTVTTGGAALLVTGGSSSVAPSFTTQPASVSVASGASATFTAAASGTPSPSYQWQKNGVALSNSATVSGATTATLTITGVTSADAGNYTVVATNIAGSAVSSTATLTVSSTPPADPGRIINISALTGISAGEDFTFGFFLGGGSGTKPLLMRAMGPSLSAFLSSGYHTDPTIEFYNGSTKASENNDWGGNAGVNNATIAVQAFGFASTTSKDAAIYDPAVTVSGAHSIKIAGTAGASGTVIAELYDATPSGQYTSSTPRLINVSLLKNVGTLTTLGFYIGGSTNVRLLIRAVGPTLGAAPFNIGGAMADPKMSLYRQSESTPFATNDDWGGSTTLANAFTSVQAFGLSATSKDAAMVQTLAPGGYSVQVSAATGSSGIALIEVYELP